MKIECEILSAEVEFLDRTLSHPLQLSSGLITVITEARATVRVRANGKEATGIGAIYLSDLWSWPDPSLSHEHRDGVMRDLCRRFAEELPAWGAPAAHPLILGLRLHDRACHGELVAPLLAHALCVSPFDAAIHDAAGRALGLSAFDFYRDNVPVPEADEYFAEKNTFAAIRAALREPEESLTAWWVVGASDDLSGAFSTAVRERKYGAFKLKLLAKDNAADVARTIEVYDTAHRLGIQGVRLSVDTNEGNRSAEEVIDYLERLRAERPDVYNALEYLEQPTSRDILNHPHDWRAVSRLKPAMLDEGLTDLSLLPLAKEQGWGGLALKTCKGHSFTLVAAAWAKEQGIPVAMQDLTNPGYAAIHSYLMAAHLDVINGIELNSYQYTPSANAEWLPRRADLFEIQDGLHRLPVKEVIGIGSDL